MPYKSQANGSVQPQSLLSRCSKHIGSGLTFLSLTMLLPGCAASRPATTIPAVYLRDCPPPNLRRPKTNADWVAREVGWAQALDACNADKAGIRAVVGGGDAR